MFCVTLETTWWGQKDQSQWPSPWENARTTVSVWECSCCTFWWFECPRDSSWGPRTSQEELHSAGLSWTLYNFTGKYSESQLWHKMQISAFRMITGFQIISLQLYIICIILSCSFVSDSLQSHELQHSRLLCSLLSPGVCSNSCLLSWWGYLTISSFVASFFSCPLLSIFPRISISGGQSIGALVSASVFSMNIQGWFPLGLTSLISLQSTSLSRVFSSTTIQTHQFLGTQLFLWSNIHICTWLLENPCWNA